MATHATLTRPPDGAGPADETADVRRFWKEARRDGSHRHAYPLLLGMKALDPPGLIARIRKGLPYRAWERFGQNSDLPRETLTTLIQISPRTLSRRKEEGRLHPDESDRLLRATRVFAAAVVLFEGTSAPARRWLLSEQPALGGLAPLDYASTEVGAREVEDLIGRLEHGIPS